MTKHVHLYLMALGGFALALTIAFVGSAGDAGAAPTLVTNGNFDTNNASWTAAANSSITWIGSEDANLNPASGAGTVARSAGGAGDGAASQCINITASGAGNYQLAAAYKLTPGGSGTQTASIDVTVYTDNACTTGAVAHPSGVLAANGGWLSFSGNISSITTELSMKIALITHATAQGDAVYFDKIALSNGPLDTPTPTNTPTSTNTATPTSTSTATNTPASTSTATSTPTATATSTMPATRTNTPVVTATPPPTDTPVPALPAATDTPVQGPPPQAPADAAPPPADAAPVAAATSNNGDSGVVGAGAAPGTDAFPASGYGPQTQKSTPMDAVALVTFIVALVMLGVGFSMHRRAVRDRE